MMAEENDVTVEVEAEPVTMEGEPVGADATETIGNEDGVAAPLENIKNPMDAMDGWTLLVALLVTSIIVFVRSIIIIDQISFIGVPGLYWWALIGSLISLLLVVVMMILKKCSEENSIKASPIVMIILLVIWIAIVFPCTFDSPFHDLEVGWLGCWGSLAVSGALAGRAFADKAKALTDAIKKQTEGGSEATKFALFLGMGSIVVLIAACFSFNCAVGLNAVVTSYSGLAGYAVAVAVISIIACVIILVFANVETLKQHSGKTNTGLSIFLIIWWVLGCFIMAFVGPFDGTSCSFNGFVSIWICLLASLSLFKACGLDTVKALVSKMKAGNKGGEGNADAGNNEDAAL